MTGPGVGGRACATDVYFGLPVIVAFQGPVARTEKKNVSLGRIVVPEYGPILLTNRPVSYTHLTLPTSDLV